MLALVKTAEGPGLELRDWPDPAVGINDVLIRVHRTGICGTDLHIEAWDPWAAKTIRPPLVIGHEFVGEVVEVGSNVIGLRSRRPGERRGPRRLRPLPPLPCRSAPPVRPHDRPRGGPRRCLRGAGRPADDERLAPLARDRRGGRRDLRPVRERGPHRARLPRAGRGRARLRGGTDRPHGHRGRPPRRRAPRRRLGAEPRPARDRRTDGGDDRGRPAGARPPRRRDGARHGGGVRRRPRDVRQRRCAPVGHRQHGPRRSASRSWGSPPRRSRSMSTRSCSRC